MKARQPANNNNALIGKNIHVRKVSRIVVLQWERTKVGQSQAVEKEIEHQIPQFTVSAPITSTLCRIIFFLSAVGFASAPAHAQTNLVPDNVEFAALKAIYDSTGGSSWTNKGGWPATGSWPASATAAQMDGWQGVTVTNGDITNLNLNNRNMTGKLPAAIGDLTSLTVLTFSSNRLSAALPATLNQLVNLTSLQCESNRITGLIPDLSALTQLSILNFRNNGGAYEIFGGGRFRTFFNTTIN